ncbi:hypothetical protein VNO77_18775 [Canavalia gladiata]|uniref:Uncharacterized protein n=1 Tax=Canavalia gladiata TaxID=3824 RepID=A0AAN9LQ48_CANGL
MPQFHSMYPMLVEEDDPRAATSLTQFESCELERTISSSEWLRNIILLLASGPGRGGFSRFKHKTGAMTCRQQVSKPEFTMTKLRRALISYDAKGGARDKVDLCATNANQRSFAEISLINSLRRAEIRCELRRLTPDF